MFAYYLDLAWRRCRQNWSMVALLVLTMAIGIAACMTALTIFGALSGEPLPGISSHLYVATMDARRMVSDAGKSYTPDNMMQLRDAKALVDAHKAVRQVAVARSLVQIGNPDGKQSSQAIGLMAYGQLIPMFGVPLRYGRTWSMAEQAAHEPVVVINSQLAEQLFGNADAVGKSVKMGTGLFRVIGVAVPWKPRVRFLGLQLQGGTPNPLTEIQDFYVPAQAALAAGVGPLAAGGCGKNAPVLVVQSANVSSCRWLETWVQLDTPAAVASWQRFFTAYADAQHKSGRFAYPPHAKLYSTRGWMALNHVVPNDVRLNVYLAGAFLVLCMVNVAGLLAARFLRRRTDVAIRRALGASQRTVFAQHLVEAGLLGMVGGLLGLPLTLLGLWIVRMQPVAYAPAATFSTGVFIVLVVLSIIVGLLVGILPAWRVCRQPPAMQIKVA